MSAIEKINFIAESDTGRTPRWFSALTVI